MSRIEHQPRPTPAFIERAVSHLVEFGLNASWTSHVDEHERVISGVLEIGNGQARHEFPAVASPTSTRTDVALLPHDRNTILISNRVSSARAQQLDDRGWGGYVDSAGNASLRADGLIIEIAGKRNSDVTAPVATAAPFTHAGLPVTFALLSVNEFFGSTPSQRSLATISGASLGTVNRVIRALRERTPPMLQGRDNQLLRTSALAQEWISAYTAMQPRFWPEERFTSEIWTSPAEVLETTLPAHALLSSEAAAARLGAPIRPASVLMHFDGDARARRELIRQGRLRKADDGMIRIRPTLWKTPPVPPEDGTVPRLLIRADLLLEDDPRLDEIRSEYFGDDR